MNIYVAVSGSGVSLGEFYLRGDSSGLSGARFAAENAAGMTLRDIAFRFWGGENTLVIEDREFGTGCYAMTTSGGPHGFAGYKLHRIMDESAITKAHATPGGYLAQAFELAEQFGVRTAIAKATTH